MILTDAQGRPIPRPEREEYGSDVDYIRAVHVWRDRVAAVANEAFATRFREALRGK